MTPRRYVIRHKSSGRYLITVGHIGWTWGSREVATEWSENDAAFLLADGEYGCDLVKEDAR
jgi:hypothetical protein